MKRRRYERKGTNVILPQDGKRELDAFPGAARVVLDQEGFFRSAELDRVLRQAHRMIARSWLATTKDQTGYQSLLEQTHCVPGSLVVGIAPKNERGVRSGRWISQDQPIAETIGLGGKRKRSQQQARQE